MSTGPFGWMPYPMENQAMSGGSGHRDECLKGAKSIEGHICPVSVWKTVGIEESCVE